MAEDLPEPSEEFLLYSGPDGRVKVKCRFLDETLGLALRLMADLFVVGIPAINNQLKNVFGSGELNEEATVSKMEIVRSEGGREVRRQVSKWASFPNSFLELSNYPILQDAGKISTDETQLKAEAEFEIFRQRQDLEHHSDFDAEVRRIQGE